MSYTSHKENCPYVLASSLKITSSRQCNLYPQCSRTALAKGLALAGSEHIK